MAMRRAATMGLARCAVGAVLILAPRSALRLSRREVPTGAAVLLMRTIGIRDLVLGLGTFAAARADEGGDAGRWLLVGLGSDGLDTLAALVSRNAIGLPETLFASGAAASFVALDLWALRTVPLETLRTAWPDSAIP